MPESFKSVRNRKYDEVDLQIIAIKSLNPSAKLHEISEQTGICITSVWNRLQRIRGSGWFQEAVAKAQSLAPAALARVEGAIEDRANDHGDGIAMGILSGLGVLSTKSEQRILHVPATEDEIIHAIDNLSTAELDHFHTRLATRCDGETGGADADGGMVAGEGASPDPQGPSA